MRSTVSPKSARSCATNRALGRRDELREVVAEPLERRQVVHTARRAPVRPRVPREHLVVLCEAGRDRAPVGV
jgi:hypothetical protein